jgi:60 kDa SS-A/Ro ribonucleoprotein
MGFEKHVTKRKQGTGQRSKVREDQVQNSAGGFVFELDDFARLRRFLVLGSEGGSYYTDERKLTVDNCTCVHRCWEEDALRTANIIRDVSVSGAAPKNDYAIFALAIGAGHENEEARKAALAVVSDVCRIGTHLFTFAKMVETQRGWGRGLRRAVANWYTSKDIDKLAYQTIKYQQRDGWSHRDLLRLSHPEFETDAHRALAQHITKPEELHTDSHLPEQVRAARVLANAEGDLAHRVTVAAGLIQEHNLPREVVPTDLLKSTEVWEALLQNMPMTALIRNLGRLSALGILKPLSQWEKIIVSQLQDEDRLRKARVHPFQVMQAMLTYKDGKGIKGSLSWTPSQNVLGALDQAFYKSFHNVEPTGKRHYLGLDVSASMSWSGGMFGSHGGGLKPRDIATCMAMVTVRTEPYTHTAAFSGDMQILNLTDKMSFADCKSATSHLAHGSTDCAQPMIDAQAKGLEVDVFVVYTDNETWYGQVHPYKALQDYRDSSGIPAKLVVVGTNASEFTIADPRDAGMLDVVGFDATVPSVLAEFVGGK